MALDYFFNSSSLDFTNLFEPASVGYTVSVDGFYDTSGNPFAFAPLSAGSAVTGGPIGYYSPGGEDVTTIWAAKGSVNYKLACNGVLFYETATAGTNQSALAGVEFILLSASSWTIRSYYSLNGVTQQTTTLQSGTIPPNAVYIEYSYTVVPYGNSQNNLVGCSQTNGASTITALSQLPSFITTSEVPSPSYQSGALWSVSLNLYDINQNLISTTSFQQRCSAS